MKLAMAITTKDRVNCAKRSIIPLLQRDKFDLFWIDGSVTEEGKAFLFEEGHPSSAIFRDVFGGPDAAIVYALTRMLDDTYGYTHVGIIEQDVLLHSDWLGPTLGLFERGKVDDLEVGAVSARAYEDRILVQRDGYALMHNLGAGHVIFTREAARIILDNYRIAWWPDNRLIFCQLSGLDIGAWAAFRGNEQWVTADWGFDAILARYGLASLALTPSLATMLDQDIAAQGLKMADGKMDLLRSDLAFEKFVGYTHQIRNGTRYPGVHGRLQCANSTYTIFPHQIPGIGGIYSGDWRLKWSQGFGPFIWTAGAARGQDGIWEAKTLEPRSLTTNPVLPTLEVPVLGPCEVLLGGTGRARVTDTHSGYTIESSPADAGQGGILQVPVPSGVSYRTIRLECLAPGVGFYGIRTREPQPWLTGYRFDHSQLPRME